MSATWRKAGFSFNKYLQISAEAVRNSLKTELKTAAVESRGKSDAAVITFENGVAAEAKPLGKK